MPQYLTRKDKSKVESFHKVGEDVVLGRVLIDRDKCKGCQFCNKACPAGALEVVDGKSKMVDKFPFCFSCGDCTAICPEGAIELVAFFELKHAFRYLDRGESQFPRKF